MQFSSERISLWSPFPTFKSVPPVTQTIEPNSLLSTGTRTWWKPTDLTEQQLCSLIHLVNPCFVWHLKQGLRAGTVASSFVVLYTQLRHILCQDIRLYNFVNLVFQVINAKHDVPQSRIWTILWPICRLFIFSLFLRELAPKCKSQLWS